MYVDRSRRPVRDVVAVIREMMLMLHEMLFYEYNSIIVQQNDSPSPVTSLRPVHHSFIAL